MAVDNQTYSATIEHRDYTAFKSRWQLIRDVLSGKEAIDKRGTSYLPQPHKYDNDRYCAYQTRAVLYNTTARTLEGYLGAIFRKESTVSLPEELEYLKRDANGEGDNLNQFAKQIARDVIPMGRHGILVDYPDTAGITTLAEQRDAGAKAHLKSYTPESIVNWAVTTEGTTSKLIAVRLEETHFETDIYGFQSDETRRWRVLRIDEKGYYAQTMIVEEASTDENGNKVVKQVERETIRPTLPDGSRMREIPFVFIGSETFTPSPDLPPLYDLAQLNIAHYRNSADWEQAVFMIGQPTPVFSGLSDDFIDKNQGNLCIGSSVALLLPEDGKVTMLESKAERNVIKSAMELKETEMLGLGARIVQDNSSKGSEATESIQLRRSGEASQLSCIADNISDGLAKALTWAAVWMGGDVGKVEYKLNKDFFVTRLTHQEISTLVSSWQAGAISRDIMLDNLRKGEVISELVTNEQVKAAIESEPPPMMGVTGFTPYDLNEEAVEEPVPENEEAPDGEES